MRLCQHEEACQNTHMHMQTSEISAALSGHFPHLSHVSFKKEKVVNDLSVHHIPVALNMVFRTE